MASVDELLKAYDAQKSPLISLLEGMAGGVLTAQREAPDRLAKQFALESAIADRQRAEEDRQRAAAMDDAIRKTYFASEQQTRQNFKGVGTVPSVLPTQKMKVGLSADDKTGYLKPKFEIVEEKAPTDLEGELLQRVRSGEMTLEQAYGMKNKGQGVSPSLAYTMQKDALEKSTKEKERVIPGYSSSGEVVIDDIEARKLRESAAEFETFKQGLTAYRELIKKHGTTEPTDRNVQGQLNAYAKNLQLKVKNLAQLGVLSISDIPFIEKQIPGPGVFKTSEGMLGALDTAEKLMESSLENKLKTSGYSKASGGQKPGKIKVTNGKETLLIDAADLSDAQNDGFRETQ